MWLVKDAPILGLQLVPSLTSRTLFQRRFKSGLKMWIGYLTLLRLNLMLPTVPLCMDFLVGGCLFVILYCVSPPYLQPLDNFICQVFIPTITGCSTPSESMWKLFSLPAHWGGLDLPEPSALCDIEFAASHNICEPLCNFIADRSLHFAKVSSAQLHRKSLIGKTKAKMYSSLSSSPRENFDASLQCALDYASVKGASSSLTALPLQEHSFALHRSAFQDAFVLRYGWLPLTLCMWIPFFSTLRTIMPER